MSNIIYNKDDHNRQKKIAAINDISGFGKCSMTVTLPIISAMGIQCCPVMTSIFSNHTAYDNYFLDDYTDRMPEYIEMWKKLNLKFDGILTGFLGSAKQIEIVTAFIREFRKENTKVIVDPIMGDNGVIYSTYTNDMCDRMKHLVKIADIATPNLTEACILSDTLYEDRIMSAEELKGMAASLGPDIVVITGLEHNDYIANYVYNRYGKSSFVRKKKTGQTRCGTGDVFSSIIAADAVNSVDIMESVRKAAGFVKECISLSDDMELPLTDGVCFEEILYKLCKRK